jgi:hypothetical protein
MRTSDQLAVEVHYFPISADELAERSSTLRNLLLRGARRSIEQLGDRKPELGKPEATMALRLDAVEK